MDPFDKLKNLVGEGLSDVGNVATRIGGDISTGVQNLGHAIGIGNSTAQPSQSQSGAGQSIRIAPSPAQSNSIPIGSSMGVSQNNETAHTPSFNANINQMGAQPNLKSYSIGGVPPNQNPNGSIRISATGQQNTPNPNSIPLGSLPKTNPNGPPPAQNQNQGGIGHAIWNASADVLNGAQNVANGIATGAHAVGAGITATNKYLNNLGEDVIHQGPGFVANNIVKPVTNTIAGAVVEPTRYMAAEVTGNPSAEAAANQRGQEDIANSLPVRIAKGIYNFGKAAYYTPEAVAGDIRGFQSGNAGMPTPAEQNAQNQGLSALNQSYLGMALNPFEKIATSTIPTAALQAQVAGFNPNESIATALTTGAAGAVQALVPLAGLEYGDPLGVFHGLDTAQGIVAGARNLNAQLGEGGYIAGPLATGFKTADLDNKTFQGAEGAPRFEGDDSRATVNITNENSRINDIINKPTVRIPTSQLVGTDFSGYGDLDRQTVDTYKQRLLQNGVVEPVLAMQGDDGQLHIEDGKNRLAAYQELGIKTIPAKIVTADDVRAISQAYSPTGGLGSNLGAVLNHPSLFNDYPQLRDVQVRVFTPKNERLYGGYNKKTNTIFVNQKLLTNPGLLKKTLLHETQHAIQNIEGFEGGTTSKTSGEAAYRMNPGEQEAFTVGKRANMTPTERAQNPIQPTGTVRITRPTPISDITPRTSHFAGAEGIEGYSDRETLAKDYADTLRSMDASATGGTLIPDGNGGYIRTSEHTPFYRNFFAENGKAPTKQDFMDEATRQLESGKADPYAQNIYNGLPEKSKATQNITISKKNLKSVDKSSPEYVVRSYANKLIADDKKAAKSPLQSSTGGGLNRQTPFSDFYKEFYKNNAKPPTKADYLQEAVRQLQSRTADQVTQLLYENSFSKPIEPTAATPSNQFTPEGPRTGVATTQYDVRSGPVQRGESGTNLGPEVPSTRPMSEEELASLAKTAPKLTMQEIQKVQGEDVVPSPHTRQELLNQADADAWTLLIGGGNRTGAVANYVEHYGMTQAQAEHRVSIVQREINLNRSSENPLAEKVTIPNAKPEDIKTPLTSARGITKGIATYLQNFNKEASQLDEHDVSLLDKLHGNDPAEVSKDAHDPEQFMKVAAAAKDYNDYTHAVGYRLGQPLPYRTYYGSRQFWDIDDPLTSKLLKASAPIDKGYTFARQFPDYETGEKLGAKRLNNNFIEDINMDAQERNNDLRRLATQQALEQAFPGKVSVGEIARDPETHQLYKQLTIPSARALSMPADIADRINTRARIEATPDLGVPRGNIKGAIAKATGIVDKAQLAFSKADKLSRPLDSHDQALLYEVDRGNSIEKVAQYANKPDKFIAAATAAQDAVKAQRDAFEQVSGNTSLQPNDAIPHYYAASPEKMNQLGIPDTQRLKDEKGFVDTNNQYGSYSTAATNENLRPLFKTPFDAIRYYGATTGGILRNQALFTTLSHAAPDDIAELGDKGLDESKHYSQAAGKLPFNASDELQQPLRGFRSLWEPKTAAAKAMLRGTEGAIQLSKKSLFLGTPFHYANEMGRFGGATLFQHPFTWARGMGQALFTQVGGYGKVIDAAQKDGTLDWIHDSGTPLPDATGKGIIVRKPNGSISIAKTADVSRGMNTKLGQFGNALTISLARLAKDQGIDPHSRFGNAVAEEIGKVIGRYNDAVQGRDPNLQRFLSGGSLAPGWISSSFGVVKDAARYSLNPAEVPEGLRDKNGIHLVTPGSLSRGSVLGERAMLAGLAIVGTAIATGKFPSLKQLVNVGGLNLNNPVPNIEGNSKNAKGESWVQDLVTDPVGLTIMLFSDPQHFASSRYSPFLATAIDAITNKNWNGTQIADPNEPNALRNRILGASKGLLPIAVQNATNPAISIRQGVAEDLGLRYKLNPNDPQVKANAAYYKANTNVSNILGSGKFSQLDPALHDVTWEQAQQFLNKFNSLHPTNTTDASGQKYPTFYDPASSETKYDAYTMTNSNGQRVLSPVFYADKLLNNQTPGYPSSPLYKLNGTGTDVSGNKVPQALVALEYQNTQDPAAKTVILNANGGQNGWLANYETAVGNYSQNYQANMTSYLRGLGWTPQALNTYWTNHPSTPDPIDTVTFNPSTQSMINQYYALSASGDSTSASQFFSKNASTLGPAFDLLAQHANALRAAKGQLQLQGYPNESPAVANLLNSMPQGSDSASKKARAQLINNNPAVSQYLADIALYESLDKGAQFRYVNPANPTATEGQNINASGQPGQTFLKDTASLGLYDIAKNPAGQYTFMQGGTFPAGYTGVGSGSGGSSKKPLIPFPPRIRKGKPVKVHGPYLKHGRGRTIKLKKSLTEPVQIKHQGPLQAFKIAAPTK